MVLWSVATKLQIFFTDSQKQPAHYCCCLPSLRCSPALRSTSRNSSWRSHWPWPSSLAAECSGWVSQISNRPRNREHGEFKVWSCNQEELVAFYFFYFSSTGGAAGHEHQADGADEKKTGVHGSAAVQQIHSRCLLSHPRWIFSFFFGLFLKTQMRMLPRYYQDVWICTRKHIMLYTAT